MLLSPEVVFAIDNNVSRYKKRLHEFCSTVVKYADKLGLQYIILYGSVARGDISEFSDIDLLFLVDGSMKPYDVEDFILHDFVIETEKRFEDDIAIDMHAMRTERFKNMEVENTFELNVNREGVVIWRRSLN